MNPAMRALDIQHAIDTSLRLSSGGQDFAATVDRYDDGNRATMIAATTAAQHGMAFYIGGAAQRLVAHAAESVPMGHVVQASSIPCARGFLLLERTLPLPHRKDGTVRECHAISWGGFFDPKKVRPEQIVGSMGGELQAIAVRDDDFANQLGGLVLGFWTPTREGQDWLRPLYPTVALGAALSKVLDGRTFSIGPPDEDPRPAMQYATKFMIAFWSFIQQRILVTPAQRADRATMRRLGTKPDDEPPSVRVVLLRGAERGSRNGEAEPVEWHYQWLVRGHWRSQWYPKDQEHRRIWVMPYRKGPEDKPLKEPSAIVFSVAR